MGSKCRLIAGIAGLMLIVLSFCVAVQSILKMEEDYCNKLVSILNEQSKITVQDVFSFEFEKAYIFNDCYISGDGFAEKYNLDISIEQVESGISENVQRIVFVDEHGSFVYEFKCDVNDVIVSNKGIVIYPETIIEKNSLVQESPLLITFNSTECYDSFEH